MSVAPASVPSGIKYGEKQSLKVTAFSERLMSIPNYDLKGEKFSPFLGGHPSFLLQARNAFARLQQCDAQSAGVLS